MRRWGHAPDVHDGWAEARIAVGTLLVAGCLGAGVIATYRYGRIWTPLQRHYLWAYAWSGVAPSHEGDYAVARIVDRSGQRLALDADLVTVTTATGERSFA